MSLITAEEYIQKYRVTKYQIQRRHEQPYPYVVYFYEPLIAGWQKWGEYMTLREAKRALRIKRRDERRWARIAEKQGMKMLHDEWQESPIVYEFEERGKNE